MTQLKLNISDLNKWAEALEDKDFKNVIMTGVKYASCDNKQGFEHELSGCAKLCFIYLRESIDRQDTISTTMSNNGKKGAKADDKAVAQIVELFKTNCPSFKQARIGKRVKELILERYREHPDFHAFEMVFKHFEAEKSSESEALGLEGMMTHESFESAVSVIDDTETAD